jgi:hypothetical protein
MTQTIGSEAAGAGHAPASTGANGAGGNGATQLTDDQILGLDASPGTAGVAAGQEPVPSEEKGASGSEQKTDGAAQAGREELPQSAAEPPELKQLFDANPELRRAWQAERAYRGVFPTVAEARELKKIFPTLADARAAAENLADLQRLDRWFFSSRPEDHAELIANLQQLDPQAFRNLARAFPQVLAQIDPEAYRADTAMRVEATLADVRAEAARRGDDAAAAAADLLANWLFAGRGAGPKAATRPQAAEPREALLTRREQALAQREAAAQQEALARFYEDCNATVVENVLEAIKSQVAGLVPEELSEGARNRVIGEIYREIDANLRANQPLAEQLRQAFRSGTRDEAHQKAVVNLVVGRARSVLPQVAKKVIGDWTANVLAATRQRTARQSAAASRVDITGTNALAGSIRNALSPREIDYRRLSDMDILNL